MVEWFRRVCCHLLDVVSNAVVRTGAEVLCLSLSLWSVKDCHCVIILKLTVWNERDIACMYCYCLWLWFDLTWDPATICVCVCEIDFSLRLYILIWFNIKTSWDFPKYQKFVGFAATTSSPYICRKRKCKYIICNYYILLLGTLWIICYHQDQ